MIGGLFLAQALHTLHSAKRRSLLTLNVRDYDIQIQHAMYNKLQTLTNGQNTFPLPRSWAVAYCCTDWVHSVAVLFNRH